MRFSWVRRLASFNYCLSKIVDSLQDFRLLCWLRFDGQGSVVFECRPTYLTVEGVGSISSLCIIRWLQGRLKMLWSWLALSICRQRCGDILVLRIHLILPLCHPVYEFLSFHQISIPTPLSMSSSQLKHCIYIIEISSTVRLSPWTGPDGKCFHHSFSDR
jgi:hypothetical protein